MKYRTERKANLHKFGKRFSTKTERYFFLKAINAGLARRQSGKVMNILHHTKH